MLDVEGTGLVSKDNLGKSGLSSVCALMLEPLLNGVERGGESYSQEGLTAALGEMFPYW